MTIELIAPNSKKSELLHKGSWLGELSGLIYNEEKFKIPERAGRVDESKAPYLYAPVETVDSECKPDKVKYHMFKRKR